MVWTSGEIGDKNQVKDFAIEIKKHSSLKDSPVMQEICASIVTGEYQLVAEVDGTYEIKEMSQFSDAILCIEQIAAENKMITMPKIHKTFFMFD